MHLVLFAVENYKKQQYFESSKTCRGRKEVERKSKGEVKGKGTGGEEGDGEQGGRSAEGWEENINFDTWIPGNSNSQ